MAAVVVSTWVCAVAAPLCQVLTTLCFHSPGRCPTKKSSIGGHPTTLPWSMHCHCQQSSDCRLCYSPLVPLTVAVRELLRSTDWHECNEVCYPSGMLPVDIGGLFESPSYDLMNISHAARLLFATTHKHRFVNPYILDFQHDFFAASNPRQLCPREAAPQ